ncbi:hypothetical protein [Acidovorax sp. sic0104]|uniref:hypothetical protein n=1 Tax=Acidovorax sp. sic0104 TaxID=2854784 RepID=UPI001C476112|nr:hypothetical protein [Acidovorax sp. sic0104]MBV7540538.1 hypothetical protein [Acidovorax sp. sic0104]
MTLSTLFKIAIALAVAFFAIEKLRVHQADKRLQGHAVASAPAQPFTDSPVQTATQDASFVFNRYQVRPLATFAVRARVLSREDYSLGKEAELSPIDLALGWKRMAEPAVYEPLNISQGGRWYRYSWRDQPPIAVQEIIESSANMHMIPATPAVERALRKARKGAFIRITGKLVEVSQPNGWRWTSSLTRSDSGANSCELVFVESALVEN